MKLNNQNSFSIQSHEYFKYRPNYPKELFTWLSKLCLTRDVALDCATGNGQAAVSLADYFSQVIATDVSAEQLKYALHHPKVKYLTQAAEELEFPRYFFDLITVAQGLHWLNLPIFYEKIRNVAKPGAIFSAWGYDFFQISEEIDLLIKRLLLEEIEPYWSTKNSIIFKGYQSIDFPFHEISPPQICIATKWSLEELIGYINTWSAVKIYKTSQKKDPTFLLKKELSKSWSRNTYKTVYIKLFIRTGRIV